MKKIKITSFKIVLFLLFTLFWVRVYSYEYMVYADIPPGEKIKFGYTAIYKDDIHLPENIEMKFPQSSLR